MSILVGKLQELKNKNWLFLHDENCSPTFDLCYWQNGAITKEFSSPKFLFQSHASTAVDVGQIFLGYECLSSIIFC